MLSTSKIVRKDIAVDQYAFVDEHYQALPKAIVVDWVPEEDRRRLKGYAILASYYYNAAKLFIDQTKEFAEFGNPAWICSTLADPISGGEFKILLTGEDEKKNETLTKALENWLDEIEFDTLFDSNELNLSMLGDCVYVVKKDLQNKRPRLEIYDPDVLFKFLDEENPRVVLAWMKKNEQDEQEIYKREYILKSDGDKKQCYVTAAWYKYDSDKGLDDLKFLRFAKNEDGEVDNIDLGIDFIPVKHMCNLKIGDMDYGISDLAFVLDLLQVLIRTDTDLANNTELMGFGILVNEDSGTLGYIPGQKDDEGRTKVKISPGSVLYGKWKVLDTAAINDALEKRKEGLTDDLLRLSRIGPVLGGKVKLSEIPSGYAARLFMSSLLWLIGKKVRIRQRGYADLLDMVRKMYRTIKDKDKKIPWDYEGTIKFKINPAIPEDTLAWLNEFTQVAPHIDTRTKLEILKNKGFEIGDIDEIIKRIEDEEARSRDNFLGRINSELSQ